MGTQEVIVDQKPADHLPVDPNVSVPKHVANAAAAAEALHKQVYTPPAPEPQLEPQLEPGPRPEQPEITATVNPEPLQPSLPPTLQADYVEPATPAELKDSVWAQRYNSMRGRWAASDREVGQLRALVDQLGAELAATQSALAGAAPAAPMREQVGQHHEQLITDADKETFGEDLINLATRAAKQALQPELDALRGENQDLKKRVTTTGQQELKAALSRAVPNWIAVNRSQEFKNWLHLRNAYTGEVRGVMLNTAYRAANAPQVIQLFRDFLNEVKATGGEIPALRHEQLPEPAPQPAPAPRTAAVALEALAAPGRARPAGGESNVPADKPTYTRRQIANFYSDVRKGAYTGRETEKHRLEADIIAAQSEGRVTG